MHNIEKSGFHKGEYVGYAAGTVWRISRSASGWGAIARDHYPDSTYPAVLMARTLKDMSTKLDDLYKKGEINNMQDAQRARAKNPAPRIGTVRPNRASQITRTKPTKRLVSRRKRNTDEGYFPNPVSYRIGEGAEFDIGNGYRITKMGLDTNGNYSVWVSYQGERAKKIQTLQNLPVMHRDRVLNSATIAEIYDYVAGVGAGKTRKNNPVKVTEQGKYGIYQTSSKGVEMVAMAKNWKDADAMRELLQHHAQKNVEFHVEAI